MGNELIAEELTNRIAERRARSSVKHVVASKVKSILANTRSGTLRKKNKQRAQHQVQADHDAFFVKYLAANRANVEIVDDIACFDERRQVFVSLLGLFRSWTKMPAHVLYSSLMILPLKRCWVYDIVRYRAEYRECDFIQHDLMHQDAQKTRQFLEMLRWKDSQGLVFWMLDDYRTDSNMDNTTAADASARCVAPFWRHLSAKLTTLYDPVSREKYNALRFETEWWLNHNQQYMAKYTTKSKDVLHELVCLKQMKFAAIQEIIYQSNPSSLNPIISYRGDCPPEVDESTKEGHETVQLQMNVGHDMAMALGEGWWISDDYDPYDMGAAECE